MRLAALVHDFGKLLTVFGERDENVDCMNRIKDPFAHPKRRGLDGLEVRLVASSVRPWLVVISRLPSAPYHLLPRCYVEWNHDEFGYLKLRRYLPPRVRDVMRYHSLRELK
jgi:predicted HD phosphohydrolase